MSRSIPFGLVILICSWVKCPELVAADPSAADLIRLCRPVDNGDGAYNRIKVCGHVFEDGRTDMTFVARYHAPGDFVLCLANRGDDTPFLYANNGKLLLYDCVNKSMMYTNNASIEFVIDCDNGKLHYKFDIAKSEKKSRIHVDVRSFFNAMKTDVKVSRIGKAFQLTQAMPGDTTLLAVVDPSRQCQYKEMSHAIRGATNAEFVIRELAVNDDVEGPWPIIPQRQALEDVIRLEDLSRDGLWENLAVLTFMARATCARFAIQNQGMREDYESQYKKRVDWQEVEVNDRGVSRRIREVIGTATEIEMGKQTRKRDPKKTGVSEEVRTLIERGHKKKGT